MWVRRRRVVAAIVSLGAIVLPAAVDVAPVAAAGGGGGSVYVPITPCRVFDTRFGAPMAPNDQRAVQVGGTGSGFAAQGGAAGGCGIPDGATAAEASVSAVSPTGTGYLRAWPTGVTPPNATFLNYSTNQSTTNTGSISLAPTGTQDLTIRNFAATSHYVIDVQGYFADPATLAAGVTGSVYVPITPCRVFDTRFGAPMAPNDQRAVQVGGTGSGFAAQGGAAGGCGIPDGATAAEASVSAVSPTGTGYLRAWPTGVTPPNATFLNYSTNQSTTNTGSISLAPTGTQDLTIRNFAATSHYVIDVQGYFADPATLGPPPEVTTTSLPTGVVGTAYPSTQLTSTGGTGTVTWAVTSGSLPPGLALSAAGVIAGTPTAGTSSSFTVRAQDSQGRVGSKSLSIAIPALSVSTTSLPDGSIGAAYPSTTLTAADAYGTKTWSVSVGSLPAGLSLSAAGAISGTTTTGGTSTFTVRVQDAGGSVATKQLTIVVSSFAITTASLPGAQQGVGYATVLAATGGSGYSWSITAGSLPAGLSLGASTGAITGTPTGTGTATFTVRVDATGAKTASKPLSIVVTAATEWSQLDHDAGGRAWSPAEAILTPANAPSVHEEWSVLTGADPVIAGGLAYAAGEVPGRTGTFAPMALDVASGDLAWYGPSLPEGCQGGQTAVTAALVLVQCGRLLAYERTSAHAVVWDTNETDPGTSTNQFLVSGTTAVTWSSDRVVAYRLSDGQRAWQVLLPSGASWIKDVAVSGSTVVVAHDDRLRALNLSTGAQLWSKPAVTSTALVIADGWIYTNDLGGVSRFALDTGAAGWSVRSGTDIYRLLGADADTIYAWEASFGDFGLQGSTVRALRTSDGAQRWSVDLSSRVRGFGVAGDVAWVAQSEIFSTGRHADLLAYRRTDGALQHTIPFDDNFYGEASFANGHVLVQQGGSFGGTEPQRIRSFGLLPPRPTITSRMVPTGRVGAAYSATLTATGGTGALTWSMTAGSLPAGMSLSGAGILSGTPTAVTAGRVQVRVRDVNGRSQTRSLYVQVLAATGGNTWSAEGRDQSRDGWNRGETAISLASAAQLGYRWKTAVPAGDEAYLPQGRQPVVLANRLVDVDAIGRLSAWDTTGSGTNRVPVWSLGAEGGTYQSSPVESGGVLYLLDANGYLDAVTASTGARLWHAPVSANLEAPGLLVQGTKILVYDNQYDLRAYDTSNGSPAWGGAAVTLDESYLFGSKVISGDGTRAYVVANCEVKAITVATGAVAWTVPMDPGLSCAGTPGRNAPILADGAVFAQTYRGSIAIEAATGTVRWRSGAHGGTYGGGGAAANGVWVIGDAGGGDGTLVALDLGTGEVLWNTTGAPPGAGYAIAGDLVVGRGFYGIGGFDLLTGEKVWDGGQPETNPSSADPPSIAGGRIYLPTREGHKAYGTL